MRHEESSIQKSCVRWFRLQYPSLAKLLIAVPNGGRRGIVEASIMKSEGVVAGVADLLLLIPSKGCPFLCIEMKTPKGRQSPEQKAWQHEVEKIGARYVVCRGIEDFIREVNGHLRV